MKLNKQNVDVIEKQMLDECEMYGHSAEGARDMLNYICGIHDMANAVRRKIDELRGSR